MKRWLVGVGAASGLFAALAACDDSSSSPAPVAPDSGGFQIDASPSPEGGPNPGTDAGADATADGGPSGGSMIGLTLQGALVRVGLDANGTDTVLGVPTSGGTPLSIAGIVRDRSTKKLYAYTALNPTNLYEVDETTLDAQPIAGQFQNGGSQRPVLGAHAGKIWTIDQFSPVREVAIAGGATTQYVLTQAVVDAGGGACNTSSDVAADDTGLWSAVVCAGGVFGVNSRAVARIELDTGNTTATYTTTLDVPQAVRPDGGPMDRSALVGVGFAPDGKLYASTESYLFVSNGGAFASVRLLTVRLQDLE
jgi:hypothetical protein